LFRVTRIFYNRFLLALAYGCSFVHRDWTSGVEPWLRLRLHNINTADGGNHGISV